MNNTKTDIDHVLTVRQELIKSIAELDESATLSNVKTRIEIGDDPLAIMEDCRRGMGRVGEMYEQGRYYISGLIMAGEIFEQLMELLQPIVKTQMQDRCSGRVLLGTIQGDIHDLGKNITGLLLSCFGFTVTDLGVDVPPEKFASRAIEEQSDIIGISCLMTGCYEFARGTIRVLRDRTSGTGFAPPVIIGGSPLDEKSARYVGADYWTTSAMEGARLCKQLMTEK